jgi:hypothetical protein
MSTKLILKWDGGSKLIKIENRGTKKLNFKIGGSKLHFLKNKGPKVHLFLFINKK